MLEKIWEKESIIRHSLDLIYSYEKCTGISLRAAHRSDREAAYDLYFADFILVSHNTETDPIFNYANQNAQALWKMDWEKFTQLPSRLSAEPIEQAERDALLKTAALKGYVDNYRGIRIDATGKRFYIENTLLWNVIDPNGIKKGQAALFKQYTFL